jgi:hypothetical protein
MKKESRMGLPFKFSIKKSAIMNKVRELIFESCEKSFKSAIRQHIRIVVIECNKYRRSTT